MDKYDDRVPVCTIGSGTRYDGKVWYESLSSIRSINGISTSHVEKSMLTVGDEVTVIFKNKPYHSVVDPASDSDGSQGKLASPLTRGNNLEEMLERPLTTRVPVQDRQPC